MTSSLVIAQKRKSPASLAVWLTLKQANVAFSEIVIDTDAKDAHARIEEHSPSGRVPSFTHDGLTVWEAMPICEYVADAFAQTMWPAQAPKRAYARSLAMEAHVGFTELHRVCPLDLALEPTFGLTLPPAIGGDVMRISAIWRECRERHESRGPFLFGNFTIVDAMFAPIAAIFATYGIVTDDTSQKYLDAVLGLPAVVEYRAAARAEQSASA